MSSASQTSRKSIGFSQQASAKNSRASIRSRNSGQSGCDSKTKQNIDCDKAKSAFTDYECLENDRFKLQEKVLEKEEALEEMEMKISMLQCQLMQICQDNKVMAEKLKQEQGAEEKQELKSKLECYVNNANKLACSVHNLKSKLRELRSELDCVKRDKQAVADMQGSASCTKIERDDELSPRPKTCPCHIDDNQTMTKLKNLQSQYANLLTEYCRKEKDCKDMSQRMSKALGECKGDEERLLNEALKKRADEMTTEANEYKVFIKELQQQVEMYREKFMKAQEKVECQRFMLENLELNNKDVESQINSEITRIKEKFQEKLSELCPYPKMYEEARVELEESKTKLADLKSDLESTLAALSKSKHELQMLKRQPDESIEKKYNKLQCEVEMMKKKHCAMKATKECLEGKLASMKQELENLRKDSSKIIATTKCCAEKNRDILHQHINCLEVDLAQCRASANLSLTEKEETIKKMKTELAALCSHFNDCQGQIKQLKNQVTYLTNQRHKIRQEDLNKIDYCFPDV